MRLFNNKKTLFVVIFSIAYSLLLVGLFYSTRLKRQNILGYFDFSNPTEIIENIGIIPHGPYLYYVTGTTKDSLGNLYISDAGNDRIIKYNIGTSNWTILGDGGTGVGQFSWPEKINTDANGNIYVADYGNDRIQKYDIGTTSWTVFLDSGTNVGQVTNPYSINFDQIGNIYVAEQPSGNNNRIQKYEIGTTTWTILGSGGTGLGQFRGVYDITTDEIGNLYVADSDNNRIQKYEIGTTTWTILGSGGTGVGQFDWPTGVDIDSNGDLYVADGDNNRIQKYDIGTTTWEILPNYTSIFYNTNEHKYTYPYGIHVDEQNNIFVADFHMYRVTFYNANSDTWSSIGASGREIGQFSFPKKVDTDNNGDLYLLEGDWNSRVQKYDIATTNWSVFMDTGTAVGQVNSANDIRVDTIGNIYVSDYTKYPLGDRIQKYNVETSNWSILAIGGTGLGQIKDVTTLGVDIEGNIYVNDNIGNYLYIYRLQKYDVGTSSWSVIATDGTGLGQVKAITDIEFDSLGNMYLADRGNSRIQKYDVGTSTWSILGTGNTGTEPGDFKYPYGVMVDNLNNIYVTEADWSGVRNYIHKYDIGTSIWSKIGNIGFGSMPGEYIYPYDMEIDQYSNLYIVDNGNHRIQKFWYYHLANYSSSDNGSVVGSTSQKLSVGQSGTQVVAVPNTGYTFLHWSDGSIANPRTDVGGEDPLSVSAEFTNTRTITNVDATSMESEVLRQFISIGSSNPTTVPNFTFNINYTFTTPTNASVVFPALTVVTPVGTSTVDLTQFTTVDKTNEVKSTLSQTLSSIQFGIPNFNLSFSSPVTVTIPVGTNYNNQTLQVKYQKEGETSWNNETTCLILNGNCTFQTTHATTFTVLENEVQQSNNNSSPPVYYYIPDHSCRSSKPISISDLFQIDASSTSAKIFFTPQSDTNDYFISFSSVNKNAEEHGERVTLLREGVQSHTIYQLKPNTTYYVKVRGQNGCMPGDWSTILKFKTGYKNSKRITKYYKYLKGMKLSKWVVK